MNFQEPKSFHGDNNLEAAKVTYGPTEKKDRRVGSVALPARVLRVTRRREYKMIHFTCAKTGFYSYRLLSRPPAKGDGPMAQEAEAIKRSWACFDISSSVYLTNKHAMCCDGTIISCSKCSLLRARSDVLKSVLYYERLSSKMQIY